MKNKHLISILTLLIISNASYSDERESLLGNKDLEFGGFGGPSIKVGDLNGRTEAMIGLKGAWLIDKRIYLGGAAYGAPRTLKDTDLNMGYGGFLVGYIFQPNNLFHYNVEMLVGAGGLGESYNDHADYHDKTEDSFSVIEPGVNASFALTRFADVNIGLSYRLVSDVNSANVRDSDLSGWSLNTSVVFGKF